MNPARRSNTCPVVTASDAIEPGYNLRQMVRFADTHCDTAAMLEFVHLSGLSHIMNASNASIHPIVADYLGARLWHDFCAATAVPLARDALCEFYGVAA